MSKSLEFDQRPTQVQVREAEKLVTSFPYPDGNYVPTDPYDAVLYIEAYNTFRRARALLPVEQRPNSATVKTVTARVENLTGGSFGR